MVLDEQTLRDGLKFIVGTWQVDYVVNAFSDDLKHIPASEFKSNDGRDFSAITYSFSEDHTVSMKNAADGREESGTWEQTGWSEYHYTLNSFLDIPDSNFLKGAETLSAQGGDLVFSLGFLAIGMKKIAEGTITEKPDIGDLQPSEEDEKLMEIVGKYEVAKAMSFVGGQFSLFTREEVLAEMEAKKAAGEVDEDEIKESMRSFDAFYEITEDHRIASWMKIPDGVPEEAIRQALESGEIKGVKDGYFSIEEKEWKAVDGKYYYNSGEHRELFGEVQSPWDELTTDEDGLLDFGSGMIKLRRV